MDNTKKLALAAGSFVLGGLAGFGVGYVVFKKKYERIAEAEIESVREAYGKNAKPKPDISELHKHVIPDEPEPTSEEFYAELVEREGYGPPEGETDVDAFRRIFGRVPTDEELVEISETGSLSGWLNSTREKTTHNLFADQPADPEDLGEETPEIPPRSPDRAYVISVGEWGDNDNAYDQITLTYWADDDVLADDAGKEVRKREEIVGEANLHRFGFLSEDADIVYVRNERLRADYEITKDERSWSEVVQGVKPDEDDGRPHRMRSNDD